jgi:hypothetical protein
VHVLFQDGIFGKVQFDVENGVALAMMGHALNVVNAIQITG